MSPEQIEKIAALRARKKRAFEWGASDIGLISELLELSDDLLSEIEKTSRS